MGSRVEVPVVREVGLEAGTLLEAGLIRKTPG
jgi:hypothetical protein